VLHESNFITFQSLSVALLLGAFGIATSTRTLSECSQPSEWRLLLQDVFRNEENLGINIFNTSKFNLVFFHSMKTVPQIMKLRKN